MGFLCSHLCVRLQQCSSQLSTRLFSPCLWCNSWFVPWFSFPPLSSCACTCACTQRGNGETFTTILVPKAVKYDTPLNSENMMEHYKFILRYCIMSYALTARQIHSMRFWIWINSLWSNCRLFDSERRDGSLDIQHGKDCVFFKIFLIRFYDKLYGIVIRWSWHLIDFTNMGIFNYIFTCVCIRKMSMIYHRRKFHPMAAVKSANHLLIWRPWPFILSTHL